MASYLGSICWISNFFADIIALDLNFWWIDSSLTIFKAFSPISLKLPTSESKPLLPFSTTSGMPPLLVEITGTPQARASKAANPKLSLEDGKINKSDIFK